MAILVCGLGRCGSSLMMQMLDAGGYPVTGDFPAYEPSEVADDRKMDDLLLSSTAMKILDPHRTPWKSVLPWKAIWLSRDYKQQARSQVKFVKLISGFSAISSQAWKAIARSLPEEEQECLRVLKPMPLLKVSFEQMLDQPLAIATRIRDFVETDLDVNKMAECVWNRTPRCQPGLDIEMQLVNMGITYLTPLEK